MQDLSTLLPSDESLVAATSGSLLLRLHKSELAGREEYSKNAAASMRSSAYWWLDEQHVALADVTQALADQWLSEGPAPAGL
jgi:hypothetical protein